MKDFIITTAIESEFPFINEYPILYTGVGKTNAAISLCRFLNKNPKTELVINLGSAGGINCIQGSIIECGIFIDGQLNYPGYEEEQIIFEKNKNTCLTFDNFITKTPIKLADCVDMESFALAKTCKEFGIRFLCFKYISDIVGEKKQKSKWIENHKEGKNLLKNTIKSIL